jgi:hypothetical protein
MQVALAQDVSGISDVTTPSALAGHPAHSIRRRASKIQSLLQVNFDALAKTNSLLKRKKVVLDATMSGKTSRSLQKQSPVGNIALLQPPIGLLIVLLDLPFEDPSVFACF